MTHRLRAASVALSLLAAATLARAEPLVTPLGSFAGPATAPLGTSHAVGVPFEDWFLFDIAPGARLTFSAHLSAGDRRTYSDNLDARLFRGDTLVQDGWDRTVPVGPGVPAADPRFVDFAPIGLGEGSYRLEVTGTMGAFQGIPNAAYDGSLTLAVAAAVPEPAPWLMGLFGVAALVARRARSQPPAGGVSLPS